MYYPGPWKVSHYPGSMNVFKLDSPMTAKEFVETYDGNRQLIECAPELLAACQEALIYLLDPDPDARQDLVSLLVNTIKRATEVRDES